MFHGFRIKDMEGQHVQLATHASVSLSHLADSGIGKTKNELVNRTLSEYNLREEPTCFSHLGDIGAASAIVEEEIDEPHSLKSNDFAECTFQHQQPGPCLAGTPAGGGIPGQTLSKSGGSGVFVACLGRGGLAEGGGDSAGGAPTDGVVGASPQIPHPQIGGSKCVGEASESTNGVDRLMSSELKQIETLVCFEK